MKLTPSLRFFPADSNGPTMMVLRCGGAALEILAVRVARGAALRRAVTLRWTADDRGGWGEATFPRPEVVA